MMKRLRSKGLGSSAQRIISTFQLAIDALRPRGEGRVARRQVRSGRKHGADGTSLWNALPGPGHVTHNAIGKPPPRIVHARVAARKDNGLADDRRSATR